MLLSGLGVEEITQLVGTLGFPIVSCAALFWKLNVQDKQHREETEKLKQAIENNTLAINTLIQKF